MKIIFVNICLRKGFEHKMLPMGLAYVMTNVKKAGIKFDFLDIDLYEYSDEWLERYFAENHFDILAFGAISTHYKWCKWFARMIKSKQPGCKLIVGNSVGDTIPELFIKKTNTDVIVRGEGDVTTVEVLKHLIENKNLAGVEGIYYLNENGEIIKNPIRKAANIDDLGMPDWEIFEIEKYIAFTQDTATLGIDSSEMQLKTLPIITARGCVFKCTFCHYMYWDDPYRHRSAESILEEIRFYQEKYDIQYFNFRDDLSFSNLLQVERLCDAIIESGIKIFFSASIRSDLFGRKKTPEDRKIIIAKKMKEAGCVSTFFSLESGSPEIILAMNKKIKPEYFGEQIRIFRKVGLPIYTSIVLGYPQETEETIKQTFDLCFKYQIYPSIGFLLPLPGTGAYRNAIKSGHITDEDKYLTSITDRQDLVLNLTQMSEERLMEVTLDYAAKLSAELGLSLKDGTYIKTGGDKKRMKESTNSSVNFIMTEESKRIENDFTFNWARQTGRL